MADRCMLCNQYLWRKNQMFCSKRCRYKYYHYHSPIVPVKEDCLHKILAGEQTEYYLEQKPYWKKRFENHFGKYLDICSKEEGAHFTWSPQKKEIIFRNGLREDAPEVNAMVTITDGQGKPEWGSEPGREYFILHICYIVGSNIKNKKGGTP